MQSKRMFKESPFEIGSREKISLRLNTSPWGGSPTFPTVELFKASDRSDVSSTLVGSSSTDGDFIVASYILGSALLLETWYEIRVKWTKDGNILDAYGEVYITL